MQFATTEPKLTWQASPKQNPDSSLKIGSKKIRSKSKSKSKKIRVKPYPVLLNEAVWQAEGRISRRLAMLSCQIPCDWLREGSGSAEPRRLGIWPS